MSSTAAFPYSSHSAGVSFTGEVRRLVEETADRALTYAVTSTDHSVVVDRPVDGAATVRVSDHEGARVEALVQRGLTTDSTWRELWSLAGEFGIQPAPAAGPGPSRRPKRVRPTAAGLLEFAADHLAHVGLHQGERPWRRSQWSGPATVTHVLTVAARTVRHTQCEDRNAVLDEALQVLADHVHGRPVVVPQWWDSGRHAYLRALVWNWADAPGRTTAGAVAFLRGAAARAAVLD